MMTNDDGGGEGGKKCRKNDDVICERPLTTNPPVIMGFDVVRYCLAEVSLFVMTILPKLLCNLP